ncbi:hypothetical protein GCM10011331_23380 [Flavimobilis marinus]|uniref:Galactosyl transferase GMA12/MNN10 family protein n=1 Tax=Flavimobilis marinus TaxID=285351 RepID=A0A1I2GL98_9MICO|nr:hypothetical protein [Flavimobilis marinus]GHG56161.1 hypothetical protein GCM10011331_23380 [Flavimobilis marinus]SFF17993.1 galactosyl transferase GMA12/MNN10 family protein [Flavimobilis marinus]
MSRSIGIISYCDHLRTRAHINHQAYASRHGYTYIFDVAPTVERKFGAKLEKIQKLTPLFDWTFWIDDDAFFMQHDRALREFLPKDPRTALVFCESPINKGKKTWISSGNFLIRRTARTSRFLRDVARTPMDVVEAWWDVDRLGYFTRGDQDAMVYQLLTNPVYRRPGFVRRLPYTAFNTRPFHFQSKPDEHFLVHFTGDDKGTQAAAFAGRFGLSEALVPWSVEDRYQMRYVPARRIEPGVVTNE